MLRLCQCAARAIFPAWEGEGKVAMIHSRAWGHSHGACVYLSESERSAMALAYVNMDIRLFLAELLTQAERME